MAFLARLAAATLTALVFFAPAASASDQTELLDDAARTVDAMEHDRAFAPARSIFDQARAVLVIPSLVKGALIFGAEGGNGVLLARKGRNWSSPAFYTIESASFGLQAGLEDAQVVMLIMSNYALDAIEKGNFELGAGGGITVETLNGGVGAPTPANLAGDIVVWISAKGLYGGLTLNDAVITPRPQWDEAFYGQKVSVPDILAGRVQNSAARTLQRRLAAAQ